LGGPLPGYRTRREEPHVPPIVPDEFRPAIPRFGVVAIRAPSRPREFRPEPLTDLDLSLSTHPARATQRKLPPSVEISRSSCCQLTKSIPTRVTRPPSLHGHYSVSSVLRGGPPLTGAPVLSASRGFHLRLFPYHRQPGLKFRTNARMRFTPPEHRTPHGP
jgi:hypothetical protein